MSYFEWVIFGGDSYFVKKFKFCWIQSSGQDTLGAPAEFISQRAARNIRSRKASTERGEGYYFLTLCMQFGNQRNGGAVINAWIKSDFVEKDYICFASPAGF